MLRMGLIYIEANIKVMAIAPKLTTGCSEHEPQITGEQEFSQFSWVLKSKYIASLTLFLKNSDWKFSTQHRFARCM